MGVLPESHFFFLTPRNTREGGVSGCKQVGGCHAEHGGPSEYFRERGVDFLAELGMLIAPP